MKKGLLIALEGPDGGGKSTQIKMLCDYLENKNYEVLLTREPGGTSISEKIRQIILDNSNLHKLCNYLPFIVDFFQWFCCTIIVSSITSL